MGRQPGLSGARHGGGVGVDREDLVRRTIQAGCQAAEGLRVPINLRLASWHRFKAHGGRGQPILLGPQRPHRQLNHPIATSIALRLEFLKDPMRLEMDQVGQSRSVHPQHF